MKLVALIHAHKEPELLRRLIGLLASGGAAVYVNLDLKSSIDPASLGQQARLVENRIDIHWGDFSQVQAVLNALAEIEAREEYDYLLYMSGQDYPVWSVERIAAFLEESRGREFIHFVPAGSGGREWTSSRYDYWHYAGSSRALAAGFRLLRGAMRAAGLKRPVPLGLKPFAGSGWFTISRRCVRLILEFVAARPEFTDFMRRTEIPDEMFFQTIVLNSPLKDAVTGDNLRYIDWSQKLPNPKVLEAEDFARIAASNAMLCRKLEFRSGARLMEMLDARQKA